MLDCSSSATSKNRWDRSPSYHRSLPLLLSVPLTRFHFVLNCVPLLTCLACFKCFPPIPGGVSVTLKDFVILKEIILLTAWGHRKRTFVVFCLDSAARLGLLEQQRLLLQQHQLQQLLSSQPSAVRHTQADHQHGHTQGNTRWTAIFPSKWRLSCISSYFPLPPPSGAAAGVALSTDAAAAGPPAAAVPDSLHPSLRCSAAHQQPAAQCPEPGPRRHRRQPLPGAAAHTCWHARPLGNAEAAANREGCGRCGAGEDMTTESLGFFPFCCCSWFCFLNKYAEFSGNLPQLFRPAVREICSGTLFLSCCLLIDHNVKSESIHFLSLTFS